MRKAEIIERTSKAMKRTPSEQSSDELDYGEIVIGELQRRLPEGVDMKTCEDFRHLNVECCETSNAQSIRAKVG